MKFSTLKSNLILSLIQIVKNSECSDNSECSNISDWDYGCKRLDDSENDVASNSPNVTSATENVLNEKTILDNVFEMNTDKDASPENLEIFFNKASNASKTLIADHFRNAYFHSSDPNESIFPKPEEPSILWFMIQKFYPQKHFISSMFNILWSNETVLKNNWSKSLKEKTLLPIFKLNDFINQLHAFCIILVKHCPSFDNAILRDLISLVARELIVSKQKYEKLCFSSKMHVAMKAFEILKLFIVEGDCSSIKPYLCCE